MTLLSSMSVLWTIAVALFVALMVYRGHLTQHETDQLFLDENASTNSQTEHDEIVRRVNRIQPFCQGAGGLAALFTMAIVGVEIARVVTKIPH